MSDERQIVKLKKPIEMGSETITELAYRRGKFGDLRGVSVNFGINGRAEMKFEEIQLVASRMCGQPMEVLAKVDEDDMGEVMAPALNFYMKSLAAGSGV